MKRFRNENGKLTCTLAEIYKATEEEGREYYTYRNIYLSMEDRQEYVHCGDDSVLIHFMSYDGYNLFVPLESCGSFLPDVASEGMELIKLTT